MLLELRQHRRRILALILLSAFVGVLPAVKSAIESAVFSHVDQLTRGEKLAHVTVREIVMSPLKPLLDKRDWIEKATADVLANQPLIDAVLAYLLITILGALTIVVSTRVRAALTKRTLGVLRGQAIRMAMTTDPSELPVPDAANVAGRYAAAIHEGANTVADTYDFFYSATEEVSTIGATLIVLATKGPWFALIFLVFVVLVALVSLLQQRRLRTKRTEYDAQRNELVAQSDEILSKREILVAYEQQEKYSGIVDKITDSFATVERDLTVAEQRFEQVRSSLVDAGRMVVFIVAAMAAVLITRRDGVSTGFDAYFIVALYARLLSPVTNLMQRYDSMKRSEGTAATFLAVLAQPKPRPLPDAPPPMSPAGPAIKFDHVTFGYDASKSVLSNCSFEVPRDQVTLILGPSGCGKSTIARLVLGFWRAERVSVGGRLVSEYDPGSLRLLMSYVAQGDHIVEDSVSDNLDWARRGQITDQEKTAVLAKVGLTTPDETVQMLERRAKSLSMGQQQRLSVARMMLDDSPIFILDEPLSGVDISTFATLLPNLREVFRRPNRTVIMTSHRLAFASFVDHVIVLDENGNVLEEGGAETLRGNPNSAVARLIKAAVAELQ